MKPQYWYKDTRMQRGKHISEFEKLFENISKNSQRRNKEDKRTIFVWLKYVVEIVLVMFIPYPPLFRYEPRQHIKCPECD